MQAMSWIEQLLRSNALCYAELVCMEDLLKLNGKTNLDYTE